MSKISRHIAGAIFVALLLVPPSAALAAAKDQNPVLHSKAEPQWLTGPRLLKLGEKIDFEFHLPLSCEYVLVENQRRQMRLERECPNPIWWFDYANPQRGPGGSSISWVKGACRLTADE